MAETVGFGGGAIREIAGQDLDYKRFGRAGDQSFNGIGIPALFMSLSGQPASGGAVEEQMARLLGGSGGKSGGLGWWWHTVEDTIDKIDPAFLVRDATIYALTLWRLCTLPLLPFDYAAAVAEMRGVLGDLATVAGDRFDLTSVLAEAEALQTAIARFADTGTTAIDEASIARYNATIMALGRILTPINYTVATWRSARPRCPHCSRYASSPRSTPRATRRTTSTPNSSAPATASGTPSAQPGRQSRGRESWVGRRVGSRQSAVGRRGESVVRSP